MADLLLSPCFYTFSCLGPLLNVDECGLHVGMSKWCPHANQIIKSTWEPLFKTTSEQGQHHYKYWWKGEMEGGSDGGLDALIARAVLTMPLFGF